MTMTRSLPDLQADPDLLLQAVLNIVRNAAQALGNAGDITVRTRVQRNFNIGSRRHRLVARIADCMIMAPASRKYCGNRFFTR